MGSRHGQVVSVQNFKNLKVYEEAFRLSKDIFEFMEDKQMSRGAKEQLLASASSICANLAEMGAYDSRKAQRQKLVICIGEANESEFWLDLCHSLKIIPQREHLNFMNALVRIRSMLCKLKSAIEEVDD
ncbi:four helix bundle protein [Candidatus Micrarchaeota archaeon]|nr:four helix bundle protein [Candidatus Micrarchaeota archaeon]MBD3417976.1 four helix bundle protein [Candidatus Micrarchaeota archaeon]